MLEARICGKTGDCTPITDVDDFVVTVKYYDKTVTPAPDTPATLPVQPNSTVAFPASVPDDVVVQLGCANPQGSGSCDPKTGIGSATQFQEFATLYWLRNG